jgi:hypothetical protein
VPSNAATSGVVFTNLTRELHTPSDEDPLLVFSGGKHGIIILNEEGSAREPSSIAGSRTASATASTTRLSKTLPYYTSILRRFVPDAPFGVRPWSYNMLALDIVPLKTFVIER